MFSSVLLAFVALAATALADCNRDMLKDATAKYIAAQTSGQMGGFAALANNVNYTENEQPVSIATGVMSQPIKIDHSRSIHDPVGCATFTEIIAATQAHPYVIGTRMLFADNKITTIESIVTDAGDWAFNATGYLYWNSIETSWDPIPADKRDSREVIKAAGDAYFNRFNNASFVVPWGTPCARLEGGAYTGGRNLNGNTCNLGLPSTLTVTNRRYVVDEEMGAVDIFVGFPGLDRSQGQKPMPDSHFFRVEGGQIRYIHTVSSCVQAGCGLSGGGPPTMRL
jgi:hypothetical protein